LRVNSKQKVQRERKLKTCAGIGCQKPGLHNLHILYMNRTGWFCRSCRRSLIVDGLAEEIGRSQVAKMISAVMNNVQQGSAKELQRSDQEFRGSQGQTTEASSYTDGTRPGGQFHP
jgi:hypothetical protein